MVGRWSWLPREFVDASSVEVFKTKLSKILSKLI